MPCLKKENWPLMVIGVTGSIGSGKSALCSFIKDMGAPVIDTDILARKMVEPGASALFQLTELFGRSILNKNGTLDREKVLKIILDDQVKKEMMEKIIHPKVFRAMDKELTRLSSQGEKMVFVEVPLLFEAGWEDFFDFIVMVQAPQDVIIERLINRKKMDFVDAKKLLSIQMSQEEKAARSDFVIHNDGDLNILKKRAEALLKKLSSLRPLQKHDKRL